MKMILMLFACCCVGLARVNALDPDGNENLQLDDIVGLIPVTDMNNIIAGQVGATEMSNLIETILRGLGGAAGGPGGVDWMNLLAEGIPGFSPEGVIASLISEAQSDFIKSAQEADVAPQCINDTLQFVSDLGDDKKEYAKQMYASFASIPNTDYIKYEARAYFPGDYELCTEVDTSKEDTPFDAHYCLAHISASPEATGSLGVCLPASCNNQDATVVVYIIYSILKIEELPGTAIFCVPLENEWTWDSIFVLFLLCVFGTLVLIGTIYDVCIKPRLTKVEACTKVALENNQEDEHDVDETHDAATSNNVKVEDENLPNNKQPVEANGMLEEEHVQVKDNIPPVLDTILVSFSLMHNLPKIVSAKKSSGTLDALNGIRVLSMFWIIWGHCTQLLALFNQIDNIGHMLRNIIGELWFRVTWEGTYAVDNFFVLSGLLLTFLTMKHLKVASGKMNWAMFYFHRFWRITPTYMICIGIWSSLLIQIGKGPMKVEILQGGREQCRKYWWTNILHLNNIIPYPGELNGCMSWSWYLANDMQFFILSPLILVLLFKPAWRRYGYSVIGVLGTICFVSLMGLNTYHGYPAGDVQTRYNNNSSPANGDFIYTKPWCRINSYLVGVVFGYLLYRLDGRQLKIPTLLNILGWFLSVSVMCCLIFAMYFSSDTEQLPQWFSVIWLTFNRTLWSLAVGWVAFACVTGHGGVLNRFLSWSAWMPLARLTFGAYLLHPMIIIWFISTKKALFHWTIQEISYFVTATICITYICALLLSLLVEGPTIGVEKALLRKKRNK